MSDPDVDEETPIFAIAVAAVAIVGGMWNVITTGGPSPTPGPTRTLIIEPTP